MNKRRKGEGSCVNPGNIGRATPWILYRG